MSAGATANRVYEDLRDVVLRGEQRPGSHLDPTIIAVQLAASTTPVREALNRLTGEGLVETRQGSGYHVPLLDVVVLKDLVRWTGDLAHLAMRSRSSFASPPTEPAKPPADHAERTAVLFARLVTCSANGEHREAMRRANDRLHSIRLGELDVLPDAACEIEMLERAVGQAEVSLIRRHITAYVRRRCAHASQLVRRRYRE